MTLDPNATTAAVTAAAYVALLTGHQLGDHPIQPDAAATAKGHPTDDRLAAGAHPWTGWTACARHVATYTAAQAVALVLVALVAPLTVPGAAAGLAVSAGTHAVIDRRWIVRTIIRAKGCHGWADGPYLIDQSLHYGALLPAAVLAALVTTTTGATLTVLASATLVLAGMTTERLRARTLTHGAAPTDNL